MSFMSLGELGDVGAFPPVPTPQNPAVSSPMTARPSAGGSSAWRSYLIPFGLGVVAVLALGGTFALGRRKKSSNPFRSIRRRRNRRRRYLS